MENAANSLKIAFAIIMLVLAITLTFVMTSKAKETADTVFFVSDETNYYDMESIGTGNREVGPDTVISTLYRLYDESLYIKIDGTGYSDIDREYNSDDYNSSKEANKYIAEICEKIADLPNDFTEQYQEIKTSGTYAYADDGSELILTPGGTKIYITYTYN